VDAGRKQRYRASRDAQIRYVNKKLGNLRDFRKCDMHPSATEYRRISAVSGLMPDSIAIRNDC
jgi:hypothetical protein